VEYWPIEVTVEHPPDVVGCVKVPIDNTTDTTSCNCRNFSHPGGKALQLAHAVVPTEVGALGVIKAETTALLFRDPTTGIGCASKVAVGCPSQGIFIVP
jgi:hypothetical protein